MVVKVYVGGLPPSADDSTVAELLSAYGRVESVSLSRDAQLQCLGYGFAKMFSLSEAEKAVEALHNVLKLEPDSFPNIGPLQLRIVQDEQPQGRPMKLFIGGVPGTSTGKALRALFQPYGEIADLFISPEKGYAFVKFAETADAVAAMNGVNGIMLPNAVRPLEVRIAQSVKGLDAGELEAQLEAVEASSSTVRSVPTPSRNSAWTRYLTEDGRPYYHNKGTGVTQWDKPTTTGDDHPPATSSSKNISSQDSSSLNIPIGLDKGPAGANVFVYGLPDRWKEKEFLEEFQRFGSIISIKVIYDKLTGASKGYGFISFAEKGSAEEAVLEMHGSALAGRKLKVQIKRGEEVSKPY